MNAASKPKLRTAFKKARVIPPLYTGGPVAITSDGNRLVTCVGEEAVLTDVQAGTEICRFVGDTESITAMCISPASTHLLLFTSALALRIYELPQSRTPLPKPVAPSRVVARAHDAPVHVCRADPTSTYLASGAADGTVKVWDVARGFVTHVFRGHGGVVSALAFSYAFDPSALNTNVGVGTMKLVTASVDTRIRIFDLGKAAERARTGGVVRAEAVLEGHVSVPRGLDVSRDGRWLVSGGRDAVVLVWDISGMDQRQGGVKKKGKGKEREGAAPTLVRTIPVLERVEAVGLLRQDQDQGGAGSTSGADTGKEALQVYTAGEKGVVRVWDARRGEVLYTLGHELEADAAAAGEDQEEQRQIVDAMYVPQADTLVAVHADQNILFHSLRTRTLARQLVGFNDEIVDAAFLSPLLPPLSSSHASPSTPAQPQPQPADVDTHVALATNSSLIRVYARGALDARLLAGHTDIVLCLDRGAQGRLLASGSKDRAARIWAPVRRAAADSDANSDSDPTSRPDADSVPAWGCVAVCEGHAESVGAVALARADADAAPPRFLFTGSQDRTIKMWDLSSVPQTAVPGDAPVKCKSLTTHRAHEKDINALDVAPHDRLLVSGSQDRTAKVWAVEYSSAGAGGVVRGELRLLGTCRGHKRGVWSVRFGRAERVLATGSGDRTVRLWSLEDFSCVKTFEGHANSVLRVDFVNAGMQMVSAASDGLVKLWNVRTEECMATMDGHEDKVWALAVSSDERTIVSGAADSVVTFWEDCTEEQAQEKEDKRAEMVLKEQDFVNYLALNDYRSAILLALSMDQPGRLLNLFKALPASVDPATSASSLTGHPAVDDVLRTLGGADLATLLRHVRDWNAHARTSAVAQRVLHAVVRLRAAEDVVAAFGEAQALTALAGAGAPELGVKDSRGAAAARELVEALIPYTERHLARMEKLVQESYVVDYLLGQMDDGRFDGLEEEEEGLGMMEVDMAVPVQA
ncbi:hypothetical protein EIP86_002233 [Pleurotus ostreatoroseus]|nr:hypothetical protein EIP86_002233 [Pleurotus ostreatoroseus]